MADVFISYSRKDIDFVHRVFDVLTARDRDPWADWQDIPPTADWLDEIYQGIEAADSFLFVISPDSVISEICTLEIEHAIKHNKRLVLVVWKDASDVHQSMSAHNWVSLREEDDFEANFKLLIDALDTDLEYVKEHTRLLTRAIEWDQNNRTRGLALSKQELQVAERWLTQGLSTEPKPTDLHGEYVDFSRTAVNRFQRLMISSVTVAFVLMMGVSVFAFYQRNQARETARISTSKSLAAFALAEMETDPELSLLLATESIRITRRVNGVVLPLSNTVLRQMIIKSRVRLTLTGHDNSVRSVSYSLDGQRIVTGSEDKTAKVWDAVEGQELMTLMGHDGGAFSVAYSPDSYRIVTGSEDKTAKVWDAVEGQELFTLKGHDDRVFSATWSPNGKRIATAGADGISQIYTTDMDELLQIVAESPAN